MEDTTGQKTNKVEFSMDTIVNNPVTKKQLEGFISEIVMYKGRIKAANGGINDIRKEAKEKLGIPGKFLNKLVRENMAPGTLEAEERDIEEVKAMADQLTVPKADFE